MPRKFFKRMMPDHRKVRDHRHLQVFGRLLHDPNLFHLNRRSVAGAFAVGLFVAFIPVPFQMVLAAMLAIFARVNLPLSVALVWVTNPLTMPPLYYVSYKLGAWLLGTPPRPFRFELSFQWLTSELIEVWQPFLLGCFVAGLIAGVLGYFAVRLFWRWQVIYSYRTRRQRRPAAKVENTSK
ncbi:MAG: DUF2062 domain-containing protein [Gammaproteobacteria bacterium]|nr:DUF2062 domain-containing protein [Gammaproteobacteria bacterium]NIR99329.1 DUF2062 domain-containing protein [Gammaproteobacteria bacterium]NIT64945.1 DUF2062 domain-containing protein [Gammaproteobacteria bacterium]NIV21908.1 DUF2062 domain-containing protein [Gammaproteobacteria bacterium]NIY33524.1 DUF2062 domain-containing protein [Gammaproteobacteria bacterium]